MDLAAQYRRQAKDVRRLSRLARTRELHRQWLRIARALELLAERQEDLERRTPDAAAPRPVREDPTRH